QRGALQRRARGMNRGDGGELPLDHRLEDVRRAPLVDAGIARARAFSFQRPSPCAPSLINARDPFEFAHSSFLGVQPVTWRFRREQGVPKTDLFLGVDGGGTQ